MYEGEGEGGRVERGMEWWMEWWMEAKRETEREEMELVRREPLPSFTGRE